MGTGAGTAVAGDLVKMVSKFIDQEVATAQRPSEVPDGRLG
jgi:hypothetical protein